MDANSGWMASWAHNWAMESSGETALILPMTAEQKSPEALSFVVRLRIFVDDYAFSEVRHRSDSLR
jgi:hypothetical protein